MYPCTRSASQHGVIMLSHPERAQSNRRKCSITWRGGEWGGGDKPKDFTGNGEKYKHSELMYIFLHRSFSSAHCNITSHMHFSLYFKGMFSTMFLTFHYLQDPVTQNIQSQNSNLIFHKVSSYCLFESLSIKKSICYWNEIPLLSFCLFVFKKKDTDIQHCHEEVRNHTYMGSFSFLWFCSCPVKSIQNILSKWRKQTISHLNKKNFLLPSSNIFL